MATESNEYNPTDIHTQEQWDDFESRAWQNAIAEKCLDRKSLDAKEKAGIDLLEQRTRQYFKK